MSFVKKDFSALKQCKISQSVLYGFVKKRLLFLICSGVFYFANFEVIYFSFVVVS